MYFPVNESLGQSIYQKLQDKIKNRLIKSYE